MVSYSTDILYFKAKLENDAREMIHIYGQDNELSVEGLDIMLNGHMILRLWLECIDEGHEDIYVDFLDPDGNPDTNEFSDFDIMTMTNIYEWTYMFMLFVMYNIDYVKKENKTSTASVYDAILPLYDKSLGMTAIFNITTDLESTKDIADLFLLGNEHPEYQVNTKEASNAIEKIMSGERCHVPDNEYITLEIVKHRKKIYLSAKPSMEYGRHLEIPLKDLDALQMVHYYHVIYQNKDKDKDEIADVLL